MPGRTRQLWAGAPWRRTEELFGDAIRRLGYERGTNRRRVSAGAPPGSQPGAPDSVRGRLPPDQEDRRDAAGHQRDPEQHSTGPGGELVVGDDQQSDPAERPEEAGPLRIAERRQSQLLLAVEAVDEPGDGSQEDQ